MVYSKLREKLPSATLDFVRPYANGKLQFPFNTHRIKKIVILNLSADE